MSVISSHAAGRSTRRTGSAVRAAAHRQHDVTSGDRRRSPAPASDVLVLAHRGAPVPGHAENSVAAVSAALDRGADGVEVDVRLTADGVLVCSHDPEVLSSTYQKVDVATSTYADLRHAAGPSLATCEEVLSAAGRHHRSRVVVEAKPALDVASGIRTAAALREVLTDFMTTLSLTVSSFDAELLSSIRDALTGLEVRTALLGSPSMPLSSLLRRAVHGGIHDIHPNVLSALEAPEVLAAARALGVGVTCWTVNDESDARRLTALGVDALITDDPVSVRAMLPVARGHRTAPRTSRRRLCPAAALPS
jgi:glycerophosphoryl diester phosphodiesterase